MAAVPSMPPKVRLPAALQTLAALRWGDQFGAYLQRGPAIRTMKIIGVGEVAITWDPVIIKRVFTADPAIVRAAEINRRVLPLLRPQSVMALDGERHLRMRRLLLPYFHGEALQRYVELFEQITAEEIERWPMDEEFAIHPRMQRITLTAVLRAVIGLSEGARLDRLLAVLPRVLEANPIAALLEGRFPWIANGTVGSALPWIRARRESQRLIRDEIAAHRAEPEGRDDILASLITARDDAGQALTDEELEDQLLTLLLAGHETAASSLAFCFERLARHPDALGRLTSGLDAGEETYVNAVINETLRLRPPVEVIWRILAEPFELGGYLLPAGTIVVPGIRAVQGFAFEDGEEFRPERFIDAKPEPYTLIPFGGGTRRCLGASFATLEMKAVLRVVLRELELETTTKPDERRDQLRRFTTIPARGARVAFRRRDEPSPVGGSLGPGRLAQVARS